ncbi:hypothetical protein M404DRAFT_602245 [Pisolithus tinctorius Marx 270]|uniref:Uncharacterized protein n=1 Tax=Pisolithus tinctorius Marx 270 TaxID=870435 RepID=A0A0C3P8N5_PISTI|nr:hypothetical protein M404DRAFT_602245 [Pisolithus tinctorius Marx 270]
MPFRYMFLSFHRCRRRENGEERAAKEVHAEEWVEVIALRDTGTGWGVDSQPTPEDTNVLIACPTLCCTYLLPGYRWIRDEDLSMMISCSSRPRNASGAGQRGWIRRI